jgi:putative membrane protein insertion efficiency factor
MNMWCMICLLALSGQPPRPPYETNPVKIVINAAITVYQKTLSGAQGDVCNFDPSCSHYSQEAFAKYGFFWGSLMTADRLMRCQPGAVNYYGRYYRGIRNNKMYDPVEQNYIFGKIEWHRYGYEGAAGAED